MSGHESYYDWELKYNLRSMTKAKKRRKKLNRLGIKEEVFKKFIEQWKKKNNI